MVDSIRKQKLIIEFFHGSKTSLAFNSTSKSIILRIPEYSGPEGSIQFFWKKLFFLNNKQ